MATPLNTTVYVMFEDNAELVETLIDFLPGSPSRMGLNRLALLLGNPECHNEVRDKTIILDNIGADRLYNLATLFFLVRQNQDLYGLEFRLVSKGRNMGSINTFDAEWDAYVD